MQPGAFNLSRLVTGVSIILFLVVIGLVFSLMAGDPATGSGFTACETVGQNATQCSSEAQGSSGFIDTVRDVGVPQAFDGTPTEIVVLAAIILGTLLTVGILLIVFSFVPTTSE